MVLRCRKHRVFKNAAVFQLVSKQTTHKISCRDFRNSMLLLFFSRLITLRSDQDQNSIAFTTHSPGERHPSTPLQTPPAV